MTVEELFDLYLDTLSTYPNDEVYCDEKDLHSIGLEGFLEWLVEQPYEVVVKNKNI